MAIENLRKIIYYSDYSYEELIQSVQAGEITYLDFIQAQEVLSEEFGKYLTEQQIISPSDTDALSFLAQKDDEFVNNQEAL